MKLESKEASLLLKLVREEIRKGCLEKTPVTEWDGKRYSKPRAKYGLAKMTNLYMIESKLILNNKTI